MDTYTWQAVVVTLIVQAAAVAMAWVNRSKRSGSLEPAPVSPHVEI
jgi:hypothetical protein